MEEDEEKEEVGSEDEEDLTQTITTAIRAPRQGDLEQILASNLAAALFAPPLDKIRMILEAFLLLPEDDKLSIVEDKQQLQYIREVYEVAVSLSDIVELPPPNQFFRGRFASIPWSFSVMDADHYLRHFINRIWDFPMEEGLGGKVHKADLSTEEGQKVWCRYLRELAGWLTSGYAPLNVVEAIKSEYITRVMAFSLALLREIFTNYITQETWEQILSIVSGKVKPRTVTL
jgi:hypothetical protein